MTVSVSSIARHVDRDRLVARLQELVRVPSENPPGNEADVAALVRRWCDELGFAASTHEAEPNRPSVIARWQGEPGPTLCYCSHIDVVPAGDPTLWSVDPYGAEISDGRMHGRGSSDAKGPIAAALEAVRALRDAGFEPHGTLELALVADEEAMGIKGAGFLVEKEILTPDVVIVGEPTSLQIVRAQRGPCWFRIITRGVAAHGSAPERGRSAIKHMAEIISHLEDTLPDIEHPVLGRPSINVGTIRGGEKVNVVPASCIAEVDRRSLPGETRESVVASIEAAVERATKRFPDIDATIELPFFGAPFEVREGSPVLKAIVAASSEAQGREAEVVGFRGSSDARFFAEAGADVVVCGPGDIALAHTARESIDLAELERGAVAYAVVFARLLSKPH
jgi:acetylornithine deacetylase/succinyl-diaminopimelate desuccinylase family protein